MVKYTTKILTFKVNATLFLLKNQSIELRQNKSNRKGTMPQNKNLTQICLSEGGFGKTNGVINAIKKGSYKGN